MADTWGESDKPVKAASNQGEAWGEGDSAVPASALRKVGDLGLSVAKGVVAVPEALVGLADIPTGGRVGKFLENEGGAFGFRPKQAKEYLGGLQSDDLRDKQQQFQKADGIIDKAGVALSNPSLITNAVAESVPLMGAGAVPARGLMAIGARGVPAAGGVGPALPGVLARTVGQKTAPVVAGAIGEGVVGAGSAAEGIRQETADGLMTAGQSGLALASGAATSVFGFAGGKLAQRLGIGDVDTMLTQGAIKTAGAPSAKSIPRQVVEGAIAEGWLEELPQSVSEQVLQNLALDKPWHEGVSDAAVMGTLAGMAMGGGAAGVSGFAQDAPPADAQQPPATPPAPPRPQAGPTLALPAPDPGVIAVGGDGTARTPAYQKPSFAGEYADVTDVVPRALAPQPADPVRQQLEVATAQGGALSPAALVAIDSGVTPRQENAFDDVPELGAQPPQVNLDEITDPYDRAYYESLFDDDPAPLGAQPVLSAFLQDDDNIPDFDAANNVSEEDFLRALGADELEIQDAIATTPDRAESAPEGAAFPAGPQADVAAGAPEGAGAGAAQPAGPVTAAPTNLRDALARVRAQKQGAANAQAATPQAAPAATAVPAAGPGAVEAAGSATTSTTTGVASEPQTDQTQQAAAQPAQAGTAPAGQPAAQRLTDGATTENPGTQAAAAPGAQAQAQSGKTEALRQQLRDVEAKILKAAPEVMGKGGGDIEAAMKSRKVPVTLKAQRKRLVEQVRAEQAVEVKTFAPETGTLGIPRADMPQVSAQSHGGLVKHLNAQGIAHETTTVDAADLKPTQAEYSPAKVEAAKAATGDRAVIVSSDGHVIDGHHQALAAAEDGKPVKAIVLDATVEQALEAVKNSPSAQKDVDKQTAALDGKAPAAIKNVAKLKAGEAVGESSTLQAAMKAAGWTAEVAGDDNTIWIKQANKERYTALLTPDTGSMEVTVLVDAVDTQIASFKVADPKAAADAANKAVTADVAESTAAAPASAEQRMPVQAIEPRKPATNKPRGVLAKKAEAEAKARADYFTPGNVVQGYSGHDRVIAYNPPGEDGQWSVTVRAVEKQGDAWMDKAGERERVHGTQPDAKALKAGPVVRGGSIDAQDATKTITEPGEQDEGTASAGGAGQFEGGDVAQPAPAVRADGAGNEAAQTEAQDGRNAFTLKRMNQVTGKMEPVTFERGEYVRHKLGHGEIDGISQARSEFRVDGLWQPFGFAYKAERPAAPERKDVAPLSKVIDKMNAKHGAGLTDADRVPAPSTTPKTDAHAATMQAARDGKATPERFQESFELVVANADAIKAELSTKTKAELLREGGPFVQMRYANEKKADVVDAVYREMVGEYALDESVTYSMGKGAFEAAVRKMVEATDADKLANYVTERQAAMEWRKAERAAKAAAIENPQTLADFREAFNAKIREGMTRKEAFLALTPEQRIKYDTLEAESTREAREKRKRTQKTQVRAAGQTTAGEIVDTKHTRDGYDLFVVKLADRLNADDYKTVLASAKKLGGWYSAFRGNGAIPGFQFKDKTNAEAFLALAGGDTTAAQEQVAQRRDAFEDDRSQTAVERLRAMADKLEAQAQEVEGRDRKANTERRARLASAALHAAAADKAKAQTMRNIAQAIEDGNAKFLDEVRTKSQVDMLTGTVDTAKGAELRAKHPSYADQEKRKGEPPTAETADFADFPSYSAFRSDLAMLGRQMLEVDGTKKLGQRLMSVADDVTDSYLEFAKANFRDVSQFGRGDSLADFASKDEAERAIKRSGLTGKAIVLPIKRGQNRVILSPGEAIGRGVWKGDGDKRITLTAEFGAEMVEAIGRRGNKQNQLSVPWQFQTAYDRRKALARIGIETPSEFRAALREFIDLQEQAVANRTRAMELQMVGRKADGLDFFPTSAEVADQMIEAADLASDMAVLEPSAGMGHLADRIREAGAEPDVIEISSERRALLEEKGYTTQAVDDFLDLRPRGFFTFGDTFRAPDGAEGIMRGASGNRVRLVNQAADMVGAGYYDRAELTGVAHNGTASGYDRIIMNPPFSNRRDAEHVRHAYSLLKPGGRIVAIMGEGVFFGNDKKAQEFREWLESVDGTSEKLPDGSFLDPSLPVTTGANARMVVIDKAEGAAMFSRTPAEVEQDIESATAQAVTQWQEGLRSAANNPQAKEPSMATPAVLRMLGAKAAKLVLPKTYLRAIMDKHGDVPVSVFENLPALLADPLFIIPHKDGGLRVFVEAQTAKGEPIAVGVSVDAGGRIQTVTPFNDDGDKGAGMRRRAYQVVQAANRGVRIYARNNEALERAMASAEASPGLIPLQRGSISRASVITRADVVKRVTQSSKPGDPRFSVSASNATPADSNARNVATQLLVDGLKAKWTRAPEIIVARNMQDAQIPQAVRDYDATLKSQGSDGEARGFIYKGKVYLLSDQLDGPGQIAEVLFHEVLGHYGLRGVFGDSLKPILQQMGTMRRADVLAKAREYGMVKKGLSDAATWAAMSEQDRLSAAEEVLAEMAQTQPNIGFVQRAIAAIRNWLRAHVPGFERMRLTDADIVQAYILPARGYVTRSNETAQQAIDRAMMAFIRTAGDQTQTEAFRKWFGDSVVTDTGNVGGNPLVVYHGSTSGGISSATVQNTFFTPNRDVANSYALDESAGRSEGQLVVNPVYIRIENPLVVDADGSPWMAIPFEGERATTDGIAAIAKRRGHDGVIIKNVEDNVNNEELPPADIYITLGKRGQIKSATGNNGDFDPTNPDIRFSRASSAAAAAGAVIKSVTATNIKQRAGFKATDYLGLGLQTLGRRQIMDIYGDIVPLAEYNTLVAQMEADKNEGGAEADKLVKRWAELPDEGKLADLMHEATLAQIDPAKPYVGGDDKAKYAMLAGRFNALSQEARQVYTDTRDAYQGHHAKVRSAIKERIERSELKGPRKAELLKQMDDEFFAAVKGVYFPLARFGQYAVTVKGADGKVESVSRAETKAEAEALRNSLLSAFPRDKGFTVGRVMLSKDFIADRDAVGRGFMTELYQVLDKQDMDAAQRAELEDTLGQLYLSSLPDLSWAKHGIHRKGTPGFSQDARRAYAQNMFHGSRYLAKLRYSDLMQDELTAMQKHVDDWREVEDFDQNSAQRVVDEMNKRHESLMNPKSNPLSTALTSFGFIFHLGLSPASAMVNLSQTALVAYPIMGAKWGFGKASAALLKASAEAAKGKNDITGSLNADERAAYDEAVRAGTIDVTMAHDLAGIAQGEDAGVMWKIRPVMRWASFLFHNAERFNRQVTFVAAYRLARDAGANHKAAFDQATKATYDGHFDYGAANRPRIMQGNVAKVLLLFKQYGQNMVYTLSRNAYQSIKGADDEKAEARKALAGLLTSHAMAAGVLGLPMVSTLLAAASMIGGDDDEPWDAKVALQNMLADAFGQKPAEVLAHGLSRLTPWDISGRVGLDRLIFPDVQEGLEGQRLAESAMAAALGPVAGIGVNVLKGAQHMSEGRYAMGLEAMLPSALRGPVKAIRYANEGVQDKSGISILDEVGSAAVAGQALGFSPSQARNAQEGKSAVMAHDRALGERRQELLTRAARASMAKDAEALDDARKEIARFNEKNPGRRINPNHIMQSVRNRNKRIDQAQDGVYLPKSRRDAMEAGRFALGD